MRPTDLHDDEHLMPLQCSCSEGALRGANMRNERPCAPRANLTVGRRAPQEPTVCVEVQVIVRDPRLARRAVCVVSRNGEQPLLSEPFFTCSGRPKRSWHTPCWQPMLCTGPVCAAPLPTCPCAHGRLSFPSSEVAVVSHRSRAARRPGSLRGGSSRLLLSGATRHLGGENGRELALGLTPLSFAAERAGTCCGRETGGSPSVIVRVLCAHGASVLPYRRYERPGSVIHTVTSQLFGNDTHRQQHAGASQHAAAVRIAIECLDELIERGSDLLLEGGDATPLVTPLAAGLQRMQSLRRYCPVFEGPACDVLALLLARWPLARAPLPVVKADALLPAAVRHARRRVEVLRDDEQQQVQLLTAAFLGRVRVGCGAAVAPAFAPFAQQRFVASGLLRLEWAFEREVHRFPTERVALCRAALHVASAAENAAAQLSVPLLRECAAAAGNSSREAEKQRYAAARAVGRWGELRVAVSAAEAELREAEAALGDAIGDAEELLAALLQQQGAAAEAASVRRRRRRTELHSAQRGDQTQEVAAREVGGEGGCGRRKRRSGRRRRGGR